MSAFEVAYMAVLMSLDIKKIPQGVAITIIWAMLKHYLHSFLVYVADFTQCVCPILVALLQLVLYGALSGYLQNSCLLL